jgi:hypothetical protein
MRFLLPLAALLVAAQPPANEQAALERGRAMTRQLLSADAAALEPQLSPGFLRAIGGRDGVQRLAAQIAEQAGREQQVLREAVFEEAGHFSYYRVSRFERLPDVTTRWVIGPDGLVAGASVRPSQVPAPTTREQYRTQARLRLPFARPAQDGAWYVAWGGRNAIDNYHVIARDQRFAYDFLVTRGRAVFSGSGARNEDHFCWGEPVLAPAAGRIMRAVGDVADNERPGVQREGVAAPGNHVVIDHGNGEYSLIAHFRQGSLAVEEGQQVAAGTILGRCGNSGRSSIPHVHYHLQTGAAYGEGEGLPAFFTDYLVDGAPVASGEPVRGQRIVPAH